MINFGSTRRYDLNSKCGTFWLDLVHLVPIWYRFRPNSVRFGKIWYVLVYFVAFWCILVNFLVDFGRTRHYNLNFKNDYVRLCSDFGVA